MLLLPFLLQLAACAGPSYYAQAVGGHLDLMGKRQEIAALLADPATDPELAARLGQVVEIRDFAAQRLDLPDKGYRQYVPTGRSAVTWNVVATPEFSLEPRRWCFLFAGCVPYRGYFERTAAADFARHLARKGYDVDVAAAVAYSTLGWFEDPVTDTMIRQGEVGVAAILFHELAHQRLYVRGDTVFNESYAGFVESAGVLLWLQESGREEQLANRKRQEAAAGQFDDLVDGARRQLAEIYDSALPEDAKRRAKANGFADLRRDYERLVRDAWGGQDFYAAWFAGDLNNARLALHASYRSGICAFASLFAEARQDMARFHVLAAARAGLDADTRRAWLQRPCPPVASGDDL